MQPRRLWIKSSGDPRHSTRALRRLESQIDEAAARSLGADRGECGGRAWLRCGVSGVAGLCPHVRGQPRRGDVLDHDFFGYAALLRPAHRIAGAAAGRAAGLRGRAADRVGVHCCMRILPKLLAATGIPRDRRHRVDDVFHFRARADDPDQPGRRARTDRRAVRQLVSDRLGRRPASGESHRRFRAQSTVCHLRSGGVDHGDRGVLQLAPVDAGCTCRAHRAGSDGARRASTPRVPLGVGLELRHRALRRWRGSCPSSGGCSPTSHHRSSCHRSSGSEPAPRRSKCRACMSGTEASPP